MTADSSKQTGVQTVKASGFEANCLRLVDEVTESGDEIVITRNGRPVVRLAPYREKSRVPFGRYRGKTRILGDIVSPMPSEWFENSRDSQDELF